MPYVSVHVDAEDVLDELDEDEVLRALEKIQKRKAPAACAPVDDALLLDAIYWHFRDSGGAPDCLREYIHRKLGKVI